MLQPIRSMNHLKPWDFISGLLGLVGGLFGSIKFNLLGLYMGHIGYDILHYAWSLLWAGLLAGFGRLCAKMVEEKWDSIKSIFKRKNKK
jgi:hypothetical protein